MLFIGLLAFFIYSGWPNFCGKYFPRKYLTVRTLHWKISFSSWDADALKVTRVRRRKMECVRDRQREREVRGVSSVSWWLVQLSRLHSPPWLCYIPHKSWKAQRKELKIQNNPNSSSVFAFSKSSSPDNGGEEDSCTVDTRFPLSPAQTRDKTTHS